MIVAFIGDESTRLDGHAVTKLQLACNLTPYLGPWDELRFTSAARTNNGNATFFSVAAARIVGLPRYPSKVRAARLNLAKNVDTPQICTGTGAIWRMPDANGRRLHFDESRSLGAKARSFLCMLMDSSIARRARREGR